ncbi:hypothetical protein [Aidingimonas halophila]|uniref:Uncharacterized protein n=1 Tax=Aidingimonas halophila TaxID=574349 RepID=A0A1H3D1H5_9GAMM|nr:hypothetical protein [Aidingimonas halophila]GHC30681.1 hypothetical protein GCM10008094_23830 [Aidingimonas halophila]SDX60186.1 hypothetical protein SAMN05443545_106163 [Aidingimonas halophila]
MTDTAILEIVELSDGEIVLRSAEGEGEPLLRIRFSEEAAELLQQSRFEVAQEMIDHAITRSKLWQEDSEEPVLPSTVH